MSDAQEALVRTPLSLDYTCGACGSKLTHKDYTPEILPDTKLRITARHCGHSADILLYLDCGGVLFAAAPKQKRRA